MIIFKIIGYLIFYLGRSVRPPREQSGGDSAPPSDSVQCVVCLGAEREVRTVPLRYLLGYLVMNSQ
jgi:hypothetical protein